MSNKKNQNIFSIIFEGPESDADAVRICKISGIVGYIQSGLAMMIAIPASRNGSDVSDYIIGLVIIVAAASWLYTKNSLIAAWTVTLWVGYGFLVMIPDIIDTGEYVQVLTMAAFMGAYVGGIRGATRLNKKK